MASPAALEGRIAVIKDNGSDPHDVVNCVVADTVETVQALGPTHCPPGHYLEDVETLPVSPGWKKDGVGFYRDSENERIRLKVVNGEYVIDPATGFAETETVEVELE